MGPTGPVYPKANPLTRVVPPIKTPPAPSDSSERRTQRPSLQQVVQRTLRGESSFREVHFVVYSRREPGGRIGGPRDVYANRELLLGHSDYLDDLLLGHPKEDVPLPASVRMSSQAIEADVYGYGDDSDLESMDGDYDEVDYGSEISTAPSSLSSNGSDAPVIVDASPPLGRRRSISTAEAAAAIHITDTAAKTWECLIYYLYTGEVHFNRSLRHVANDLSDTMHCSPKSMYRLADKVGLPDLMEKCEDNLMEGLSESNIIQELSSTFTSKYEDVQTAQIDCLFTKCFADDNVRADLNKLNRETLAGKHPHAHGVLGDIFERLSAGYWRDKAVPERTGRDGRIRPVLPRPPSRERSYQGSFTNLDPSESGSLPRPEPDIYSDFNHSAHTRPSTRPPSRVEPVYDSYPPGMSCVSPERALYSPSLSAGSPQPELLRVWTPVHESTPNDLRSQCEEDSNLGAPSLDSAIPVDCDTQTADSEDVYGGGRLGGGLLSVGGTSWGTAHTRPPVRAGATSKCAAMPMGREVTPEEHTAIPRERAPTPEECAPIEEPAPTREELAPTREEPAPIPHERAPIPHERAPMPHERATTPEERAMTPRAQPTSDNMASASVEVATSGSSGMVPKSTPPTVPNPVIPPAPVAVPSSSATGNMVPESSQVAQSGGTGGSVVPKKKKSKKAKKLEKAQREEARAAREEARSWACAPVEGL